MRFDEWWSEDGQAAAPASDLPLVPDGTHTGEITKVQWKDLKFKVSDTNKSGTSLVVEVTIAGYRPVEAIVPAQYRGLIEAICRAARQPVPVRGEDWDCDVLDGKAVTVDTVLGVGKTGREFIRIDNWHRGPDPLPAAIKSTPKRTPAAKVEAVGQGGASDDIPF